MTVVTTGASGFCTMMTVKPLESVERATFFSAAIPAAPACKSAVHVSATRPATIFNRKRFVMGATLTAARVFDKNGLHYGDSKDSIPAFATAARSANLILFRKNKTRADGGFSRQVVRSRDSEHHGGLSDGDCLYRNECRQPVGGPSKPGSAHCGESAGDARLVAGGAAGFFLRPLRRGLARR